MTNLNANTFISLYVTRTNRLNNDIFKDLSKGVDSATYKACIELTTLSNEELYENGYKAMFEFKKNAKGKKVLVKKRQFKNDTSAYKSIIENIENIVEFSQTAEAKSSKVNGVRGVVSKTNSYFNPKPTNNKNGKSKNDKSQVGTSKDEAETEAETFLSADQFVELATIQGFTKSDLEKIILGLQKIHGETKIAM